MNNKKKRALKQASKPVRSRKKVVENISHIEKRRKLARERKSKLQSLQTPPSETESVSLDSIERIEGTNNESIENDALILINQLLISTVESSRIDKTNISLDCGYIFKDDSEHFREYLGGQICDQRNNLHRQENLQTYSLTSNIPQNNFTSIRSSKLEVGSKIYAKPLISGRRNHGGGARQVLKWKLNVNPTKIINNIDASPLTDTQLRKRIMGESLLSCSNLPILALDGKDNILPLGVVDSEYQTLEKQIFKAVYNGFDREVNRVADLSPYGSDTLSIGFDKVVFNEVEVYWEVEVEKNAHGLFDRLLKHFSTYSKSYREREHGFDVNDENNARSACIYLNDYERIEIYIKSETRLRFEVRFDLTGNSRVIGNRTCKSLIGTIRFLKNAKKQALNRILHFSDYLKKSIDQRPSKEIANDTAFIIAWASECGNSTDSIMLINILRSKGCLVVDKSLLSQGSAVEKIIKRAKRKKLLVYKGGKLRGGTHEPNLPCKKIFTSKLTRLCRDHIRDV